MKNIKQLLGSNISRLRKEKGYSQIEFAEILGISTNALSVIETGKGFLTAETLDKVLKELNVSAEELFSCIDMNSCEILFENIQRQLRHIKNNKNKLRTVYQFLKIVI